jgi:hypothetical protein
MSLCVGGLPDLHTRRSPTHSDIHIPDVVLIQLILLLMSTMLLETRTGLKQTYKKKRIVRQVVHLP